jgi:hypothetical protein
MPEPIHPPEVTHQRCRLIRSKGMFIEAERDPTVPHTDSGLYWCVHTQNCLGPDGKVCTLEDCKPERACYEPL